jgi:hypothetical protein
MNTILVMNVFTLLIVLTIWLPCGASSVAALFVVIVLMGFGTGSFVPLGGKGRLSVSPGAVTKQAADVRSKCHASMHSAVPRTPERGSALSTALAHLRTSSCHRSECFC